jgi:RNA-directed DNA polymerase
MALEPRTEAIFHEDSYGYRPRKGALDAVGRCRERCWARDWVIDLDVRKFFDSVPWDLMVKAVQANVTHEQRWITLYVRRWLAALIVMPDGRTQARDKGTPQGGLCSAEHKDPNAQCWLMRSASPSWLVRAGSTSGHCA